MNVPGTEYCVVLAPGLLNVNAYFALLDEAPAAAYCSYQYN